MSEVISNSIVVIAILLSAGYAVWRLGPRKMRDALRRRFNLRDNSSGSACDACGGGCAPTTSTPAARKEHGVFWRKKAAP
jgi:hypothetical protein